MLEEGYYATTTRNECGCKKEMPYLIKLLNVRGMGIFKRRQMISQCDHDELKETFKQGKKVGSKYDVILYG